ncbi:MAG: hypothetical protein V3V98_03640, partial [Thermoplasmata archaeon]
DSIFFLVRSSTFTLTTFTVYPILLVIHKDYFVDVSCESAEVLQASEAYWVRVESDVEWTIIIE